MNKMELQEVKEVKLVTGWNPENTEKKINKLLSEGWQLLSITQDGMIQEGISTIYTLGRTDLKAKQRIVRVEG